MPTMKSTFTLLSALAVSTLLAGNLKAEGIPALTHGRQDDL